MSSNDEEVPWSAADSDPPAHRCGFELLPEDVDISEDDLERWRARRNSASCCREVWENGRCRWHADASPDILREAVYEVDDTTDDEDDSKPLDWDQTARVYHDLKLAFDDNGFVGRARRFHIDERRARRHETAIEEGWFSWPHLTALVSGTFTGYGVGVRRLLVTMAVLFTVSTVTYAAVPVRNPLLYSIITFTTAPPGEPASLPIWAQIVAGVETFLGTLLIVSLGFVLGNREQF